jgi:hypothetical protein
MDDGKRTTQNHRIAAHGTTILDVVYTNDTATVDHILEMYEQWLESEQHRFVGLDLEYTPKSDDKPREIAVVQLAMRTHVLVFHYCRYIW